MSQNTNQPATEKQNPYLPGINPSPEGTEVPIITTDDLVEASRIIAESITAAIFGRFLG